MKNISSKTLALLRSIHFSYYKIAFALVATIIISSFKFELVELFLFDLGTTIKADLGLSNPKNKKITLIYIDSNTIESFNGYPSYKDHSTFLEKLSLYKSSQIVYNFRFENKQIIEISGSTNDQKLFAKTASTFSNLYFITDDLELKGQESNLKLAAPLNDLQVVSGPRTKDIKLNPKNKISRRILISYQDQLLIHQRLASIYNPSIVNVENIRGKYHYIGTDQVYIDFHKPNSFDAFRFEDVLSGNVPPQYLTDRIILIGTNTNKFIEDYVATPYSSETPDLITITELQANMFQTLIDNSAPQKVPPYINIIVTAAISILTVYVALSMTPSKGIMLLVSTFLGYSFLAVILLYFNIWIGMAHPLLTIFLCYYFFIPYRLIIENRRSWEYLQKNKLLQQVEELKSNFISMMSHDLKTPIARIQGMTEVILKDNISLSSNQREAVDTIKSSSDDLLRFINSILQYGRIESQGIELNRQSKDINKILQEIVKKHDFLAKVKRIKLTTDLEPMFPVSVDSELVRQVFSNLIENAIKYSPEESTVTIKSYESADKVIIEIQDQGVGIPPEEISNIFMKFYRSQNAKTSTIKGTGLGLYLAQYFIQLHKGEITVTSEVQKGSVFRVELPINS
ncbi:ATP-binding protein [Pseudobdellovibrio exovorus]|uniref:histidine kinase n=1 Tax=Pseudobdellovibrio exovorus JSS TaxID=1184267 RepID=M4VSZ4_9BACT|nr:ATP-binding protein [Pseudobdellovibrio exovorus]AGH96329.1 sensory transduction histidine kinase [Pseudobdellovibrio exovorus JSS]